MRKFCILLLLSVQLGFGSSYDDLLKIFNELRQLERTETKEGIPDYTPVTLKSVHTKVLALLDRVKALDTTGWTISQKVDAEIVRAEINGFDFSIRVLKPWERDPAFYAILFSEQSDTPEHEGPASHAMIDVWKYSFPLSKDDSKKLAKQLRVIPPLIEQATQNLTGNAKDLWMGGIQSVRGQVEILDDLIKKLEKPDKELKEALQKARIAYVTFAEWLEQRAPEKTGPSGIGKANYTWLLQNVYLVPMTWEDELTLLKRELNRAYAGLALEQHHNRNLPPLKTVESSQEYDQRAEAAVKKLIAFLEQQQVMPVKPYFETALRRHMGSYRPADQRNFFLNIMHHAPEVLYSHSTHWFELERMKLEPHSNPIRRDALGFNVWMTRSEGLATALEEIFMNAGLYDDNPRGRELVYVMLAQRCARGIASLYAQANEMTMTEAQNYQIEWTPPGWNGVRSLVIGEQQLYLEQPGYGTSYVTGKALIDQLIKDRQRQLGNRFMLRDFFEQFYDIGIIPTSLIRYEMTGMDDEIRWMNPAR